MTSNPATLDVIAYTWQVLSKMTENYYLELPKPYVADGKANTYCCEYIDSAWKLSVPVSDAAFVLCNKIQRREWETRS